LTVPPGVSGLSQIRLPPDTELDSVRRKTIMNRQETHTADPHSEPFPFLSLFA
jgi:hypothetical protein